MKAPVSLDRTGASARVRGGSQDFHALEHRLSESGKLVDDKRTVAELAPENREQRKHRLPKGGMGNPMSVSKKWLLTDLTAASCTTFGRTRAMHPDVAQKYAESLHILDMSRLLGRAPMADLVPMLG